MVLGWNIHSPHTIETLQALHEQGDPHDSVPCLVFPACAHQHTCSFDLKLILSMRFASNETANPFIE